MNERQEVRKRAAAAKRARSELRGAIIAARQAGLTLSVIGEAARLSKQRVHQIIREEEGEEGAS